MAKPCSGRKDRHRTAGNTLRGGKLAEKPTSWSALKENVSPGSSAAEHIKPTRGPAPRREEESDKGCGERNVV